jgi:hypothetical protein
MMKRVITALNLWIFISVLSCGLLRAQATAQISGTVKDQTGAVLPGVDVTATRTDTGVQRATVTNETGSFVMANLPLGPYRLEAALPGFRTYVQTGIVLQVNSNPVVNPVLEVGQVTEQVEVQANAALVETRNVGVGQVIENQRILELPLNGRNVTDLITLAGSSVLMSTGALGGVPGTVRISVAGSVEYGVSYNLDGAMHNNPFDNANLPFPFPDALQEFKLETSGLTAQNGGHSGGSVNSVTKSGTNELHGDLFEFVRNDLFNARPYFALTGSTLKRNQFGGTLGGPIAKNRLFFFGGYQRTTLRQDPANLEAYVPTAAMLAGDFTAFASPQCNTGRQINLRAPFVNNRVSPALFNKAAVTIASRLPKSDDACGLFKYGRMNNNDDTQYVGKVDYQRTDKDSIFGRVLLYTYFRPLPFSFTPNNILNTVQRGEDDLVQMYTIGDTHLYGPNVVNAFRMTVNRSAIAGKGASYFSACDVGIKIYCGLYKEPYMILSVTGGGNMAVGNGANGTSATYRVTTYQISDDVSVVRGNHQMAFGAIVAHHRVNQNSNSRSPGNFTFNGQETGLGMADFLLGRLSQFQQGGPSQLYLRQSYFGMYAQDTWKVRPKLTVNAGVRWEPYLPLTDAKGANYNFSYDRFKQGTYSTTFKNAPAGFYYNGDPGFPTPAGVNKQWLHFGPHVGLAWDVNGDGRTSVRASYAMAYDFVSMKWRTDTTSAPPWGNRLILTDLPNGLEDPWAAIPGGNIFPYKIDANVTFAPAGLFMSTPYNNHNPNVQSWNLSLQKQIGTWVVSTSYLGSQMTHLWATKALNPSIFLGFGPCTLNGVTYNPCSSTNNTEQRRRLTLERPRDGYYIGGLDEFDDGGTRNYHGLRLSAENRVVNGLTINGNYTWSHCIGDFADTASEGPGAGAGYVDPNNRDFDRGNCSSDRRQLFNFTTVAQTPRFENNTMRAIATGWRLSGIYRRATGSYQTVTAGTDRALNGISTQRANQILGDPYSDKSAGPMAQFLNPLAFAIPSMGTLGNMGRYNIRGVGEWAFDTSLSRTFQFHENQRLEFRAEAFNVLNSFRPMNPNAALNSSTFGTIRTAHDPRIMQFALKYVF